ncbi:MAG TPA: putative lipid II flippase FtsW [Candidatus Sulfotelmatobacter sp.]|nr:putative lipid II flippase FtsW [Candidatus Sulfotelmatobacter sp.]
MATWVRGQRVLPNPRLSSSGTAAAMTGANVESVGVDGWLLTSIIGLTAFGLVMVYSASEALGYAWYRNANYFFQRQIIGVVLGLVGMLVVMRVDYHRWRRFTRPLAIGMVFMLVLVLVPHIGADRFGARRWFMFGSISVQPSAIATLVAIICLSQWLADRGPLVRSFRGTRDYMILLGGLLVLILMEKDFGTTLVMALTGMALLTLGGVRKRHLFIIAAALVVLGYLVIKMESYRASRLAHFGDPFADPLNTGFQSVQALFALGSGGFTGVGLGNSIEKYQWLPEAHTDFIFAIIGEELGLLGTLCVIGAFVLLAWRGVRACLGAPDVHGSLLAAGVTAWISIQAFINIGAVTNVIPTTGLTLPFISYGGTSLAVTLIAVGILCNVSTQARRQGAQRRAYIDRWRGNGRSPDPRSGGRPGVGAR